MLTEVTRNIVILIIVASILELLLPRNEFRPFLNMVVGLVLMLTLLAPLRTMLQVPGELELTMEQDARLSQGALTARQAVLEQLNWDLAISRYRELLTEQVSAVLAEEKMSLVELSLQLEENPGLPDFGRPQRLTVLAKKDTEEGNGGIARVEKIRIGTTRAVPGERNEEAVVNGLLAIKLGEALGISKEKIEVQVLKN
jgi:stage III sporulation protein AF